MAKNKPQQNDEPNNPKGTQNQPENQGAGASDLHHFHFFSNKTLIIMFLVIEAIIIVLMYPDYKLNKNRALGMKYSEKGEWEKAKQHYLIIKGIYPESETINYELGNVYMNLKDYQNALACFKIAEGHQKKPSTDLLKNIGLCYINTGNRSEALLYFKNTLEKSPNDPDANFYLGEDMVKNKKYDEAAKYFQRIPTPESFGQKLADYWKEIEVAVLGDLAKESAQ